MISDCADVVLKINHRNANQYIACFMLACLSDYKVNLLYILKFFKINSLMLMCLLIYRTMSINGIFSYQKLIIKEGYGKYKPIEFSECYILLHLQHPEQQASNNAVSSIGYQLDEEIKILVGHGMTHVACTVDLCVQTMFEGEKCRLQTKCNVAASAAADDKFFTLEVTLLSFLAADELHSTTYKDKLMRAVTLKELGMSAFTAGNISAAFHKFSRSLKYLTCAAADDDKSISSSTNDSVLSNGTCTSDSCQPDNGDVSDPNMSNWTGEDIARMTCNCWLNLAACQLRYHNFKMAAVNCTKALNIDPNNVKGLFRRAQSNMKTGNEHAAVVDLEQALALEPGNREITRLLSAARQLTCKSYDKLAAAMSKMFQ